jgi:hypothetical protein
MIIQYIFVNNKIYILLQFNASKHQLSTQRYEPSMTAHVVRKLQMAVVAFGTTIPNHPSIITLFRFPDKRPAVYVYTSINVLFQFSGE